MGFLDGFMGAGASFLGIKALDQDEGAGTSPQTWPTEAEFGISGDIYADCGSGALWAGEYAVRTVVDFVASNIASLPFHAYRATRDGHTEEAGGTETAALLDSPSAVPGETRYRLVHALVTDSMLHDRFLCVITSDGSGSFKLRRVPPELFSTDFNGIGEPTRIRAMLGGAAQAVFDLPDPRVVLSLGYGGASGSPYPVPATLRPLLDEARELARYRRSIARNSGRVPAWVSRDAGVEWRDDAAREAFVQGLRNYRRGGGAEGGWPLLEDGMQIHTLDAFKPVDMADLDARDRVNVAVANAYHISPENLGFRTGNKSSVQAYKEQLWNVELKPYIVALEQTLTLAIPQALGEPDVFIRANLAAQLRGTTSEQYQALSTATGRPFMTTDEARRILDMPHVEGSDELITPLNVTQGAQPSPQDGGVTQNAQRGQSQNGGD